MDVEKLSYTEAMEELARKAGVQIRFEESEFAVEGEKDRQALFELYDRLSRTFHWFLIDHASGRNALEVLRKRGLSDDLIRKFSLGYAPANRQWLYSFLKTKGYSDTFLRHSGLFSKTIQIGLCLPTASCFLSAIQEEGSLRLEGARWIRRDQSISTVPRR